MPPGEAKRHLTQIIDVFHALRVRSGCGRHKCGGKTCRCSISSPLSTRGAKQEAAQKIAFRGWPIIAAYLRALADLGLSDLQIAGYLEVHKDRVTSLRSLFGIPEGK